MSAEKIEQTAAHWLLQSEEPGWSEVDEQELQAWLEESMAHKAAYWRLSHGWRRADRLAALSTSTSTRIPGPAQKRRLGLSAAVAAALAMVAGAVVTQLAPGGNSVPTGKVRVATKVGDLRRFALADGTKIELNTGSELRGRLGKESRQFWLDRGEAYFEVAHARERPFIVHAADRVVTVTGTKFSVRVRSGGVTVNVAEGQVKLASATPGPRRSVSLSGGTIAVTQGRNSLVASAGAEKVQERLAWREGRIVFDQTSLAEAAEEFNRYSAGKKLEVDPSIAGMRIGGSFESRNAEGFLRLLKAAYGLRVEPQGDIVRISA